ncbi:tetratricopeptide repeat protein [Patescibacteria group bacterium]|nr:tetratricopeptide repeat protein [Patescibacteria group bacterium]MBU4512620.1 tetratricopeptide repeat protein [Patescibacteria group bacterium]MCG2693331.1 tetratricopeptide repeat protein [Candidatus Parcubacteria bacterium]
MIYNILPIIIIILSLAVIIIILIRRVPDVTNLNVEQLPEEKQKKVKRALIQNKLDRKLDKISPNLQKVNQGLAALKKFFEGIEKKILAVEHKYSQKHKKIIQNEPEKFQDKVVVLLGAAESLVAQDKLDEAEKKYIEIIGFDPQNIDSYRGLAGIYLKQKNFSEAKQALEHVLKLLKNNQTEKVVEDYINLGMIYRELGEQAKALASFKKALKLEPNNPRSLDLLCEMSIIVRDKKSALYAYKRLKEVNPENQKLEEFKKKTGELS